MKTLGFKNHWTCYCFVQNNGSASIYICWQLILKRAHPKDKHRPLNMVIMTCTLIKKLPNLCAICTGFVRKFYSEYLFCVLPNICIDICINFCIYINLVSALIDINFPSFIHLKTASICINICIIYIHLISAPLRIYIPRYSSSIFVSPIFTH